MGKVLITGITGNVGFYVYKSLIDLGEEVKGGVRSIEKARKKIDNETEVVEFDFIKKNTYDKALESVDRVFLMRPPHIGKPEDLYLFINAMKRHGVKMLSFLSLMGIEKNPVPPHYKIEKYIEKVGLPYCHIRPGFFMQNISEVHAKEIKDKNEIFIPAGKSKCSFIDAYDIGLATAEVLHNYKNHINTAYTITGRESLNYYEVADILSEVLGRKITYGKPSMLRFRSYMIKKRGLDKGFVTVMMMLYFMTKMGTAKKIYGDFEKITNKKTRTFREFAEKNKEKWI
ncbi:MAG: NmrA family NAD(P)-binding protein [Eubacteriales bacterium]